MENVSDIQANKKKNFKFTGCGKDKHNEIYFIKNIARVRAS